jgi:hypothetical protein
MKSSGTNEMFLNFKRINGIAGRIWKKPGEIPIFALKIYARD